MEIHLIIAFIKWILIPRKKKENPYDLFIVDLVQCGMLLKENHNIPQNQCFIFLKHENQDETEISFRKKNRCEKYHHMNK